MSALFHISHLDERMGLSEELVALAQRIGERELEAMAHHWRGYDLLEAADVAATRLESAALVRVADGLRQPAYWFLTARWDMMWAMLADQLDAVEPLIARTHDFATRARLPEAEIEAMAQHLAVAYRQRATGAFAPILESSIAQNPHLEVHRPALALAQLHAGNREAAAEEFERIARDDFAAFPRDILWFSGMCVAAEVCALLGDSARAHDPLQPAAPVPDALRRGGDGDVPRVGRALPRPAGGGRAAAAHFESALASNAAAGIVSMVRMVRDDYAGMLEARGAPGDAERAAALRAQNLPGPRPRSGATEIVPPARRGYVAGTLRVIPNGARARRTATYGP